MSVKLSKANLTVVLEKLLFNSAISCGVLKSLLALSSPYLFTNIGSPTVFVACCKEAFTNLSPT